MAERVRRKKSTPPPTDWAGSRVKKETTGKWLAEIVDDNVMGQPAVFPDDAVDRGYRLALLGLTHTEMAVAFGVGESTISSWLTHHPEFRAAVFAGREMADGEVVRALYKKAVGYEYDEEQVTVRKGKVIRSTVTKQIPPDTTACIYWLNNRTRRQRHSWNNSQKMEITGAGGGPILLAPGEAKAVEEFSDEELKMIASAGIKLQIQHAEVVGE